VLAEQWPYAFALRYYEVDTGELATDMNGVPLAQDYPVYDQDGRRIRSAQFNHPGLDMMRGEDEAAGRGRNPKLLAGRAFVRAAVYMSSIIKKKYFGEKGQWMKVLHGAHNAGGYDFSFIVPAATAVPNPSVHVLSKGGSRFLCVDIGEARLVDTMNFQKASLGKLAKQMHCDTPYAGELPETFQQRRRSMLAPVHADFASVFGEEHWDRLIGKGLFPYSRVNSAASLSAMRAFPPREHFASELNGGKMPSVAEYEDNKATWAWLDEHLRSKHPDHGGMNGHEWSALYCALDTALLASTFLEQRRLCMEEYGIDMMASITLPGVAWEAAMKMVPRGLGRLELIDSEEMFFFVRQALVGGFSGRIGLTDAVANFPEMEQFPGGEGRYDPTTPKRFLFKVDMNALYGGAMFHHCHPVGAYRWRNEREAGMSLEEWRDFILAYVSSDEEREGFFAEVDIDPPASDEGEVIELYDRYMAERWPLLPGPLEPRESWLSEPMTESLSNAQRRAKVWAHRKLCMHLLDIRRRVFHASQLNQALRHGYRLRRVHRVLFFRQKSIFRDYVQVVHTLATKTHTHTRRPTLRVGTGRAPASWHGSSTRTCPTSSTATPSKTSASGAWWRWSAA